MNRWGCGVLEAGTRELSITGLTRASWNVGCTLRDLGSLSCMAAGLSTLEIGKGLMKRGANLHDSTLKGRSFEDNHTI